MHLRHFFAASSVRDSGVYELQYDLSLTQHLTTRNLPENVENVWQRECGIPGRIFSFSFWFVLSEIVDPLQVCSLRP